MDPLSDISEETGTMDYISGSHLLDYNKDTQSLLKESMKRNAPIVNYGALRQGQIVCHAGSTLHYAPANQTEAVREVIAVTYFSDPAYISKEPLNKVQTGLLEDYFPGLKPGDQAASRLNPIVYDFSVNK